MLKKIKVHSGWLVYRKGGSRKQHTHFYNETGAIAFIKLMKRGILPDSPYFAESARRVLTEKEFKELRKQKIKQKYVNRR